MALLLAPCAVRAQDQFSAYLFAYFTGNDKSQEAIRFAISDDGYNYKAINKGNPVLSSASISSTGGVRDPHILRGEKGDYYMVATDMVSANGWNSNRGMVLLKSTNLVDWTSAKVHIPTAFPSLAAADRVWAPQTIYDPAAGKYMVYFAMRLGGNDIDKIYYAYANGSFTALESTPKVLYTYNGKAAIDGDIVLKDSLYHLFFKTEGSGNGIKSAVSKTLTGPYVLRDKYLQATTNAVEGSCVFKLSNSDTWILMYDMYTSGQYQFTTSKDLVNFAVATTKYSFDFTPRHGTVIPITMAEKNALNAKWNPGGVVGSAPKARSPEISLHGDRLSVRFDGASAVVLSIRDLAGREALRTTVAGTSSLDVSRLPRGIYEVVVRGTDATEFRSVIERM
jgi:hypothetical protein